MVDGILAKKITNGDFVVTAELLPAAAGNSASVEADLKSLNKGLTAVNVADNCHNIGMSSIAASAAAIKAGAEPICNIVTRDRNRIALQSDLLGAACLGIKNVMCLSGYHQTLLTSPDSANVYDIDSTQFVELATNISEKGVLANGTKTDGQFSMFIGAVANPFLKPMELNMMRLSRKADAGAKFLMTSAVYDVETFNQWLDAAISEGITSKAGIIASVYPLKSAEEARTLRDTYSDYCIPDGVLDRLKKAGDEAAQKKEGLNICIEAIGKLKKMKGLRGIHILCGFDGKASPEAVTAALS